MSDSDALAERVPTKKIPHNPEKKHENNQEKKEEAEDTVATGEVQ